MLIGHPNNLAHWRNDMEGVEVLEGSKLKVRKFSAAMGAAGKTVIYNVVKNKKNKEYTYETSEEELDYHKWSFVLNKKEWGKKTEMVIRYEGAINNPFWRILAKVSGPKAELDAVVKTIRTKYKLG